MGFFQKLKKLKFWKKRKEGRNKGKGSKDGEPNIKDETSKQDVEPDLLEYTEELKKKLQQKVAQHEQLEATIHGLEETLEQQYTERERVEATCQGYMSDLANKVVEKYTLKSTIEELERKLQEQMRIQQEKMCDWANVEEALHGQVTQLTKKFQKWSDW
jgi:chromosome segregation ATPase